MSPTDPATFRSPRPYRMRVLSVLSSTNQMYSGIGRNVFEQAKRLRERVDLEFTIDDHVTRNVDLVVRFGREQGMPVHVGRGRLAPEGVDAGNDDLPDLLRQKRWDLIEAVCFANATTNAAVLDEVGDLALAYTPHHQPTWTVPMSPAQAATVEDTHRRMVQRADVVLCDSPWERAQLQRFAPGRNNCRYVPLGCEFRQFQPGRLDRREQLLFVGDLAEPRKRFDRVLRVFARLLLRRPTLRLVVVGNRSDDVSGLIPADLRPSCDLRGYVDEATLRATYAESRGLFLLSDFEAFGIPILEALACGTPVFLSDQGATRSLFGPFPAAHFCPADDEGALAVVERVLSRGRDVIAEALAGRLHLQSTFDWDELADRKWRELSAAWFRRRRWAWTA